MHQYLASSIEFARLALTQGGYWIVFVVSAVEAIPVLGTVIPGQTMIFFAGFLAKLGILTLWQVIVFAFLGAVCGDLLGFSLGRRFGYVFLEKYGHYIFIKKDYIEKLKEIIRTHTGKSLILGRFNPLTRTFTPYLAGAGGVTKKKFWKFNVIGGISWAVASVVVGFIFGASYEVVSKYIGKFVFIALVLSILIIWGYSYIESKRHIFAKYHLFTLIINIASLYVFFKTLEDSFSGISTLAALDVWINLKMLVIQTPFFVQCAFLITRIFSPLSLSIAALGLLLWLAYRRYWHHFWLLITSLSTVVIATTFMKYLVERVRPDNSLDYYTDYSFPSLHASFSIVFFCVLFYIFHKNITNKNLREMFGALVILAFLLTGLSRVYLNAHWLSDVVGGFSLGLFILSGIILLMRIKEAKSE